ncbi:c-type cytochrome [Pelagovum pacificum]|uniref:Cytochrome c n=1 Tax=Pelagovum pacificum TaxID=2588711 RepID=A0A5C5GAS0_9RHOB|nr:cytochrome c [Pelagovum pacificum]QQA41302.1 cytochrome c [Pelagovum pacificum]TNY31892.1 cytochrome c [Pelagovum pacificum]
MQRTIPLLLLIPLAACAPEPQVDGAMLFQQDCAACHGADAMGDGPFGHQLIRQPPDLTRLTERAGGTFPRNYVMSVIDGYHRDASFSAAMPEFGASDLGPMIVVEEEPGIGTPVPARLWALADYLESVQR